MKNCIVPVLLHISYKNKIRPKNKKKEKILCFLLIEEKRERTRKEKEVQNG